MRKNFLYKILALMLMSLLPECGVLAQGDVQKTNVLGAQSESVAEQCDTLVDVHIDSNGDTIYTYSISPIGLVPMTRTSSGESIYSDEGTDDEGMIAVLDTDVSNATMKNVGSVPFDESVSPSGARIYSVPIRTAPGLAFVPNISLAYNSQSGNGVAGYGWNVSGGSVITLVQKTIHYDGTCAPIDVSNPSECVFALDGVRLIPNCGVLTSKYQYETAQGKILVEKHLSGNTVAYFTVAYPNGNVATFGFKDNTAMRVVYPITELRDVRGNMMSFQYFEAGNNYYLSKVSYGSRPSSRYLAEIDFLYEDRDDFTEMYIGGLKVSASKILKGVVSKTMFNGSMQELCSYVLSHKNTGGACRLSQLDCTSGGQSLTPLTFSYIADRNSAPARMNRNGSLFLEKYFAKESGAKPVFVRGKFVKNRYDDGLITFPGKFSPYGVVGYKKTLSGNKYPYNNVVNDNTYLLGLPVKVVTESLRSRDSKLMTSETTEYDAMYQPLRKVSSVGANKLNETHWTYDVYGNVTSETSAPYDVTTFVGKSYEYDSDGRFVVASTDALGLKTSYAGFDKNGNAGTVTDVRGLTTNFAYDVWGRLTDVAHPDGTIEESVLVWGGEGLYTMLKKQTGKPTTIVHYDSQQREIRSCKQRFDDKWQMVDKVYDERGRLSKVSLPFIGSAPSYWNVYTYDEHDRPVSYDEASGKRTHWSYGKLNTTETKDGMTTTRTVDATGTVVKVEDAGGTIVYNLRSDDQLASIVAPGDVETTFTYDEYGRKTSMNDPSFGLQTMSESWRQDGTHSQTVTDADGRVVTTNYDVYGRKVSEVRPEFTTNFAYDEYGNLLYEKSSHGIYREYAYNQYGQLEEQSTRVLRNKEVQTFKYENGNLVAKTIGLCFNNSDNVVSRRNNVEELYKYSNGSLVQILLKNLNVNNNVWQLLDENEYGQPTKVLTGSMQRVYAYDEYGTPKERRSGDIMHESYQFDNTTGNLLKRTDVMRNLTETFGYDDLNRLVRVNDKTVGYAANGNILNRTGVGSFEYDDADKPYAVTGLVRGEANACTQRQSVAYNSLMRPQSIENDSVKTTFLYDVNGDRVIVAKGSEKNYYLGEYEVINNAAKQIVYLGGDAYTAPMAYVGLGSGFSWALVNICRDYLGSITHIASYSGNSLYEYSYDAWGNMRNPDTWEVYPVDEQPELYLGRGYTGHEHLREYGLINMNARLYDPEIGRFISPDPYVQHPDCSQNFNRYSYCLNNPMKYTDESGEFFLLTGIIAIGNTISNVFRHGLNFSQYTWNATVNSFKLDLGMFKGNVFQVLNKWTWGFVNSVVGYTVAQTLNVLGQIKYITDLDGMLAISGPMYSNKGKAFTIAHYSFGPRHYKADWRDHLFVHEYGHYMQAQRMGIGFVYIVGIPSLLSAAQITTTGDMTHSERWFEVDASTLGAKHFDKHYGRGAKGYIRNDENYFDIYSFWNSATTPYTNPRTGDNEQKVQVSGKSKFIIWDLFF